MVVEHLKQIGKVKKLDKWVSHKLIANKKIILSCCLLLFFTKTNHFSIGLWRVTKSEFYMTNWQQPAQWLDQEQAPNHFPKPNFQQNKSWSLVVCCQPDPSFWIWQNHYIWEVCSEQISEMHWKLQHLQLALVNRKDPILHNNAWLHVTQPALQKWNELGYEVLPHLPYSPDFLPTDYHFFEHLDCFLKGICFHNQ